MPIVKLFGNLRSLAGWSQCEFPGKSVGEVLGRLCEGNLPLKKVIFEEDRLQTYVRVQKGGSDIELEKGLDTPLLEDDQVAIFPPIAGG